MAALGDHPLAATITARMALLKPVRPNPGGLGFVTIPQSQWGSTWQLFGGSLNLTLGGDGSATLGRGGVSWEPFGALSYRVYNQVRGREGERKCRRGW